MSSISLHSSKWLVWRILLFGMFGFISQSCNSFESKCANIKYTKHLNKRVYNDSKAEIFKLSEGTAPQIEEKGSFQPYL